LYIDSHCHLDRLDLALYDNNLDNVINAAKQAKVNKLLCVSVTLADFPNMVKKNSTLSKCFSDLRCSPIEPRR
jgi:TatD DNase family protein